MCQFFFDLFLQIILFSYWNDWTVEINGNGAFKGMSHNPSISPWKTRWVPLTTWIRFLSIIVVHPSSHICPKDMRDVMWRSLNTYASHSFLYITEDFGIWTLKEEVVTSLFGRFKTWFVAGFVSIKTPLLSFLKWFRDAPLSDFASMVSIMGGTTEGKVICKYEELFLPLSITSLSVTHFQ